MSDIHVVPPVSGPPFRVASTPNVLLGPRGMLHTALKVMSQHVADLYLGALWTLESNENPDRYAQAAHSLRELMNAVPVSVGVEVRALDERMGDRLTPLRESWQSTMNRTTTFDGKVWSGEIDGPLALFLERAHTFFSWLEDHRPRRRAEFADTLTRLDSSGRALPPRLQDLNVQTWMEIRAYFIDVCHHRKVADRLEFNSWLEAFELFLLDRLQPRTFNDFDDIDAIVAAGEGS
jgi:hypothetical protein